MGCPAGRLQNLAKAFSTKAGQISPSPVMPQKTGARL